TQNYSGIGNAAVLGQAVVGTTGTVSAVVGTAGHVITNNAATTINHAAGLAGSVGWFGGAGSVDTAFALHAGTNTGNITHNYGILVEPQTAGVNDYGIAIGTADTQTLWIANDADHTTANAGI